MNQNRAPPETVDFHSSCIHFLEEGPISMATIDATIVCPSQIVEGLFEVLASRKPARAAQFACSGHGLGLGLCANQLKSLPEAEIGEVMDTFNALCEVLGEEGISLEILGKPSIERTMTPLEAMRAEKARQA